MPISADHANASPVTPVDVESFGHANDRERLTPVALKAFKAVAVQWQLSGAEAAALLGVSEAIWDRIARGIWHQALSQDQLTRASAMIGIYQGLKLLLDDDAAVRWPRLRNSDPIFRNRSPVEAMIAGGIPVMLETRQYIDAVGATSDRWCTESEPSYPSRLPHSLMRRPNLHVPPGRPPRLHCKASRVGPVTLFSRGACRS